MRLYLNRALTAVYAPVQLFAIVPMGQGAMSSQLGSMLAGPSVVPEAQMLGAGPEMFNCMGCTYPLPPCFVRFLLMCCTAADRGELGRCCTADALVHDDTSSSVCWHMKDHTKG